MAVNRGRSGLGDSRRVTQRRDIALASKLGPLDLKVFEVIRVKGATVAKSAGVERSKV